MGTADEFDEVCVDWADHAWGFCDRHLQGMGENGKMGDGTDRQAWEITSSLAFHIALSLI
jgi:hypothetical protein